MNLNKFKRKHLKLKVLKMNQMKKQGKKKKEYKCF